MTPTRHVLDYLRAHAHQTPNKPFVHTRITGDRRTITYAQAWHDVLAIRARLRAAAIPAEGVALILLPQGWEALAYYFGAIAHGCAASYMPLPSSKQNPDLYWASHDKLMARITPTVLITSDTHGSELERHDQMLGATRVFRAEPITAKEPATEAEVIDDLGRWADRLPVLQHSSGTTGLKKGVMLTHRAIENQVWSYAASIDATADDVVVSWLPLYHDMGLIAATLTPLLLGQTIVLMDPFEWVGRPATLFDAIDEHQGTLCWLPNFAFDHLVRTVDLSRTSARLASMRAFISCSEVCQPGTHDRFLRKFQAIGLRPASMRTCYAMAESTFAVTQSREDRPPPTITVDRRRLHQDGLAVRTADQAAGVELLSVGTAIDGATVTVRDDAGAVLADGVVGEVCVQSNCLFDGYYRLPEETARRLFGDLYRTRDRGFLMDGELYILGRVDDLVIVAGRNFHATEIEDVLNTINGLKPGRNVVFGLTNAERGTNDLIAVAETVDEGDTDPASPGHRALRHDVRHAIFQALGIYPAEVKLVPQGWLLKTSSGKIERGRNALKYQDAKSLVGAVSA